MTVVWHHHATAAASSRPPVKAIVWWLVLAVAVLGILGCLGYFSFAGWRSPSASAWFAHVPLPVARSHGRLGWYSDVAKLARGFAASEEREALEPSDFTQALDVVSRRLHIARLARQFDVSASDQEIDAELVDDADLQAFLALARWSMDDYRELVLRPFVVSQKLETALDTDREYQQSALETIAGIEAKLALGIAFEDVAQQYSEDESAQAKGNLGYLLASEVDPGLAPVFTLAVGETSGVLEAASAFWIIRVEDVVREADGDRLLLRGIAVNKQTVGAVVDDLVSSDPPTLFVRTSE